MGMQLVTNRDITVTGTSGSSIRFTKGEPTFVPDQAVEECMAAGAIPVEGETLKAKPTSKKADAPQGDERKQIIMDAIETLVLVNERGSFNANGAPKIKKLETAVGFTLDTREVLPLWTAFDIAQKSATPVDAAAVATVKDSAPVVTEDKPKAKKGSK